MQTLGFRAMNTEVLLAARDDPAAGSGLDKARDFINKSERRFSRFIPDSELSRLNSAAGTWVGISADLMELLQLSHRYYEATRGLFDPSVLADLVRAGYDRTMDAIKSATPATRASLGDRAARSELGGHNRATLRPSMAQMVFDLAHRRVLLPAGLALDLGGIAKGWIVQKAAMLLSSFSLPCAASAGGDIYFVGEPMGGQGWPVEIEDPTNSRRTIASLSAAPGAVVTSSVTKRRWSQNGIIRHHIIDPRTGEPAVTSWLSATVIADQTPAAEAYAKAILIGGLAEAERLRAKVPGFTFLMVDQDRQVYASQNGRELIYDNLSVNYCS